MGIILVAIIVGGVLIWVNSMRLKVKDEDLLNHINDSFDDL